MKARRFLLVILYAVIFASCSPAPTVAGNSPDLTPTKPQVLPSEPPPTPTPESSSPEGDLNPSLPIPARTDPQTLIKEAREDLAERLSVSVTLINLVEIDEVLWPDASLGCPQAGHTYAQTQTLGYLVKLEYAGDEFEYHANIHGTFFYCENPTPPISATPVDINP